MRRTGHTHFTVCPQTSKCSIPMCQPSTVDGRGWSIVRNVTDMSKQHEIGHIYCETSWFFLFYYGRLITSIRQKIKIKEMYTIFWSRNINTLAHGPGPLMFSLGIYSASKIFHPIFKIGRVHIKNHLNFCLFFKSSDCILLDPSTITSSCEMAHAPSSH